MRVLKTLALIPGAALLISVLGINGMPRPPQEAAALTPPMGWNSWNPLRVRSWSTSNQEQNNVPFTLGCLSYRHNCAYQCG